MASLEPCESNFDREEAIAIAANIEHVAKAWLSVPERLERAIELASKRKAQLVSILSSSDRGAGPVNELIESQFGSLDQTRVQALGLGRKDPAQSLALGCPVPNVSAAIKLGISNSEEAIRGLVSLSESGSSPSLSALKPIVEEADRLVCLAKTEPAYYFAGSLYNILHGTLEQVSDSCTARLDSLIPCLEGAANLLSELHHENLAQSVLEARNALLASDPTAALVSANKLRESAASLPRARKVTPVHRQGGRADMLRIVAVDDEQIWRDFAKNAASIVGDRLEGAMPVSFESASNATEARERLLSDPPRRNQSELTIAVVDMGLPGHPDGSDTAGRDVGQRLLQDLRRYSANIPCVVLTTPSNTAEDMSRACGQGVGPREYLLKTQSHSDLAEAILRLAATAQKHVVIWDPESPDRSFELDGVRVALDPMHFRTFCALCDLSAETRSLFFSREQILDRADELFNHEFDYSGEALSAPDQARFLARRRFSELVSSVEDYREIEKWIVSWHHAKAGRPDSLEIALRTFASEFANSWEACGALLARYRSSHPRPEWSANGNLRSHRNIEEFSTWFDLVYGGIKPIAQRYDDGRFHDHFNEIREAIHLAFQRANRFEEPRSIIQSGSLPTGGYRLEAVIRSVLDSTEAEDGYQTEPDWDVPAPQLRLSVLVVEDDPSTRERLENVLTGDGFDVRTAASIQEADPDLLLPFPQVLCLDLAIPDGSNDHDEASIGMGLLLLKRFKEKDPNILVLCATASADLDSVRTLLVNEGIGLGQIIPKRPMSGHPDWMAHLLAKINALRNQRSGRADLTEARALRPIVELLEGTEMQSGKIRAKVNGQDFRLKAGSQGKLLLWFLTNPELGYEPDQIMLDFQLPTRNALKKLIQYIRQRIQRDWLCLPLSPRNDEAANVLSLEQGVYVMHAQVTGPRDSQPREGEER